MRSVLRPPRNAGSARLYSSAAAPTLRINAARLHETLHHTCQWGFAHRYGDGPTETGMNRLALTDDDMAARMWFRGAMEDLGAEVTIDQLGNMFAQKSGKTKSSAPMIAMGSHLDTQPRGGRYDGILGVVAAVEAMRTLQENNYETHFDVGVVNWTNEEGARFPMSMMASGVWAGKIPLQTAWNTRDVFDRSKTVKSELERLGLIGSVACSHDAYPISAHFELHIEQSPVLQDTGRRIGVVQGAQAYKWFTVHVTGRDSHTGTTPLYMRRDPLLAAAKMVSRAHEIAKSHGALASTGIFKIPATSSTNTIAAEVSFSLDVRHPENSVVATVVEEVDAAFANIAQEDGKGVSYKMTLDTDSPAVKFDKDCIRAVENAATKTVGKDGWSHLTSGAGHDSVYTSKICPTTMIFVPCKDGVSHHPEEYTSPEDCALGAQTLLDAVVEYDQFKANQ
ncbi:Amidase, hydantoinase/carbamoylase [Akanthomyces lecanii RCEF 1005]|uniref:Amidase, hydantoinase/carbamoylase n=1 Tax=Akanthomyces lecanii RCEF 1005 TaxID=1081108 RepID=A0A167YIE3_CORDF|nr:Amidase, hydantoinase/carbamoylase [Akanthomyces lecanii RCEF 1005]